MNNSNTLTTTQRLITFDVVKFLNRKNSKRKLAKFGATTLVLAIVIGGFSFYNRAYADKIYPKVMAAGVNIGGLTRDEAKAKIDEKIKELNENGPEITYNDQTLKPKLDEMGLTFDTENILNQAFNYGRKGSIENKIKENYNLVANGLTIDLKPQIEQEKFDAYLGQLAKVAEKEAVNASLSIKNGDIILASSQNGRGLDKEKLKNDLTTLINSGNTTGKIVMNTSDFEPQIKEEGTIEARAQAEKYMVTAPITVTFPSGLGETGPVETGENSGWTADKAEIGSWIKFNENGDKLVASINPSTFINYVAKQIEIGATDREIEDGTGNVLSEGQDGRGADKDTLTAQINDALARSQGGTFALAAVMVPRGQKTIFPHAQPGRYGSKYIDINLSEQTLYAFEGSTLVNQFLVSTGKPGYSTPTGEFAVYGKDRASLMDGPGYYLPNVPFISWFSGDYSIHGTYWHNNFGTPMSHGCINASIGDAEWIFNWDDVGTPVYIHY